MVTSSRNAYVKPSYHVTLHFSAFLKNMTGLEHSTLGSLSPLNDLPKQSRKWGDKLQGVVYLAKGLDKQLGREIANIVYLWTALHTIKYFPLKPTKYYKWRENMDKINLKRTVSWLTEIRMDVFHRTYLLIGFLDALVLTMISKALDKPVHLFIFITLCLLKNLLLLKRSITRTQFNSLSSTYKVKKKVKKGKGWEPCFNKAPKALKRQ